MLYHKAVAAFAERARSRKLCVGIHHSAMSPQLVELYGHLGLDFVVLSQEVESLDKYTLENLLRAGDAGGAVPIVKLLRNEPLLIEEAMNAGAALVMVPHVHHREHLDAAIHASRFVRGGKGSRHLVPVARYTGFGAYSMEDVVRIVNESHSIIPIIEDAEALAHVEDIISHPDVDIVELGPMDLAQSLGLRSPELTYAHPPVMEALEKIGALARKYQKGLVAPLWLPKDCDTPTKVIQWQHEQLVKRGVTIFYAIEVRLLGRILRDWLPLREVEADA